MSESSRRLATVLPLLIAYPAIITKLVTFVGYYATKAEQEMKAPNASRPIRNRSVRRAYLEYLYLQDRD